MKISKLDAAKSQLVEAINLFFEDRDPMSIHTLVGAATEIFHDHISAIGNVWQHDLFFHRQSIYIKDEYRKVWQQHVRRYRNFFKHADYDLKRGVEEIDFDPNVNEFHILDAMNSLRAIEQKEPFWPMEFRFFCMWYFSRHLDHIKKDERDFISKAEKFTEWTKEDFRNGLAVAKARQNVDESQADFTL